MDTKYNNGHVIDVNEMKDDEFETAAKEWAEGSKSLEELLRYCLNNGIITQACCIGHKENDMSFLQFELSEKNKEAIIKLINRYYNLDGVNMTFYNQPGVTSNFDIRVPKEKGEQFFGDMLTELSNGIEIGIESLPYEMQTTLDAMLKHKVPNDILEVQYKVEDGKKDLFVATNNPNYSELYWDKPKAIPWFDDCTAIGGLPEEIEPIIKDIAKKAPIEYSNYVDIENYRKKNNVVDSPVMSKQDNKEEITPIAFNLQATYSNDYARENGLQVVEVLPGMDIDEVAKAMCGHKYIGKFNNFEIDGTKYDNAEDIVTAYKKHWEEGRQRLLESKKKQEQVDNSIREKQFEVLDNNQELTSAVDLEGGEIKR